MTIGQWPCLTPETGWVQILDQERIWAVRDFGNTVRDVVFYDRFSEQ
jgi:hypothetical protein